MTDNSNPEDGRAFFGDELEEGRINAYDRVANPYPHEYPRPDMTIDAFIRSFSSSVEDEDEVGDTEVTLAGRVTRLDDFGGIAFLDLRDESDSVQIICEESRGDVMDSLEEIQLDDWISVTGVPGRSSRGEFSIVADEMTLTSKSLQNPMVGNVRDDRRLRRRGAALRNQNDSLHESVEIRFDVLESVRSFLTANGYREVDTPIIHSVAGGADASTFETHVQALDENQFLRIAPELYLKRLLTGGFEQVFEIGPVFRNEDIDRTHQPEFHMLEAYAAYHDYRDMMDLFESIVSSVAEEVIGTTTVEYQGNSFDLSPPWNRMTVMESLEEVAGLENVRELSDSELHNLLREHNVECEEFSRGMAYVELFEELVEDELVEPTIIMDYPVESTPLCKEHRNDESLVERFEAFVDGVELANAYTELQDPFMQAERMIQQADSMEEIDEEFLLDLAHGLPPCGGIGIGVDRLSMLLADTTSLREVRPFPMHRSQ